MSNVTPLTRPTSLEIIRKGNGLAIMRGGEVQAVLTRDELPQLVVAAATMLSGKL